MSTRELFCTPKFDLLPEMRWCNIRYSKFNPLPHGPETKSIHVEIIVKASAPDDFTEEDWESLKGCVVMAGGLGVTAAVSVMITSDGKEWPATITAFEETFNKSFISSIGAKFSADIAKNISSNVSTDETHGSWTHH